MTEINAIGQEGWELVNVIQVTKYPPCHNLYTAF